jgi:hypothetical protein
MYTKLITLCTLGLSTLAASTHLADIRAEAARIEREGQSMQQLLKAKQPDAAALQEKLTAAGAGIEKLRELVMTIETQSNGSLNTPDWALVKEKVQLLAIFHQAKTELMANGDLRKQRTLLRAHADGMAKRAQMLQKTASRLALP